MSKQSSRKISILPALGRLVKLSGKQQPWLYFSIFIILIGVGLTMIWNVVSLYFIDSVIDRNFSDYYDFLWLIVVVSIAVVPIYFFSRFGIELFTERTMAILRKKIADRMAVLPVSYLEKRHTGDILGVINADLIRLHTMVSSSLLQIIFHSLMAVAALIALFVINWKVTIASTLISPVMMFIMSKLNQPIAKRTQEMQQAIGETVNIVQDGIGGLMVTRAFNLTNILNNQYNKKNQEVIKKGFLLSRLRAASDASGMIFSPLPFLITFVIGGYMTIKGQMTFGELFIFINLLTYLSAPIMIIPPLVANVSEASGAAQRTYQILDQPVERTGGSRFLVSESDKSIIRFEKMNFSYDKEPVLKDINLNIKKGQIIALVGPSGSGKSTLLKLLIGFYPVNDKSIFLYEHDLNDWDLTSAREQFAFVDQDTYLFPVSIAENIARGKPDANQEEIENAAKLANIHDYIISLSEGYSTLVGERGARLSGGQRQRLSLARAILKDAPMILLDEPTSALDTESEAFIQEALERVMQDRTTIVIAHRLSTIRNADRVIVLEEGRIIEDGTHDDLLALNGRYKNLYERQLIEPALLKRRGDNE